jgi:multiple sugar transport system ATP-binding protein
MAQVRLVSITKKFGETTVIPGLDLDIADREFVVLVGPSGCGKNYYTSNDSRLRRGFWR